MKRRRNRQSRLAPAVWTSFIEEKALKDLMQVAAGPDVSSPQNYSNVQPATDHEKGTPDLESEHDDDVQGNVLGVDMDIESIQPSNRTESEHDDDVQGNVLGVDMDIESIQPSNHTDLVAQEHSAPVHHVMNVINNYLPVHTAEMNNIQQAEIFENHGHDGEVGDRMSLSADGCPTADVLMSKSAHAVDNQLTLHPCTHDNELPIVGCRNEDVPINEGEALDYLNSIPTQPGPTAYGTPPTTRDRDQTPSIEDVCTIRPTITVSEGMEIAKRIYKLLKKKFNRKVLFGMMSLYGVVRFTLRQYDHMAFIMSAMLGKKALPSSSSLRQSILTYYIRELFVKSNLYSFPCIRHATAFTVKSDTDERTKRACVVLPSEWAKSDIATVTTFRQLICGEVCRCHVDETSIRAEYRIENAPIIQQASLVYDRPVSFWINDDGMPTQAKIKDTISFNCIDPPINAPLSIFDMGWTRGPQEWDDGEAFEIFAEVASVFWISSKGCVVVQSGPVPCEVPENIQNLVRIINDCVQRGNHTVNEETEMGRERANGSRPSKRRRRDRMNEISDIRGDLNLDVRLGDVCTFIVPTSKGNGNGEMVGVYLNKFWRTKAALRNDTVAWFHNIGSGTTPVLITMSDTIGTPQLFQRPPKSSNQDDEEQKQCMTGGVLKCGLPFYIYRVLLYTDDFNPRSILFPSGSVGGCYMIPVGLSLSNRQSLSAVHTISLSPAGVSTNLILDEIISDFVTGATNGFDSIDIFGQRCKVFVELIGFVADYPASSAVLDVMGHTARSPCTHCTFRRRSVKTKSNFAYSGSVHSSNSSFARGLQRIQSLRQAGISGDDANYLGLKVGDFTTPGSAPLLKLGLRLSECRKNIPMSQKNLAIMSGFFDPYVSNCIAPDHLLTGLAKGLLECSFLMSPTCELKLKLDLALCAVLKKVGVDGQTSLFNTKTNKLHNLSMSTVYGIMTVLPSVLDAINLSSQLQTMNMIRLLNQLISLTFWWPSHLTDGHKSASFVLGCNQRPYHRRLLCIANDFLRAVSKFCSQHPNLKKLVDRPNTHRLLELYIHTIPLFGHVSFFSELVFEAAHQPLKFSLSRNAQSNAHLYAVHVVLARDWFTRLGNLWQCFRSGGKDKYLALNGLRYFTCGAQYFDIPWTHEKMTYLKEKIDSFIISTLEGDTGQRISEWYARNHDLGNTGKWFGEHGQTLNGCTGISIERWKLIERTAYLVEECTGGRGIEDNDMLCYKKALFRKNGSMADNRIYEHHVLHVGDSIQVLLEKRYQKQLIITPSANGIGEMHFFSIAAVVGFNDSHVWIGVTELKRVPDKLVYNSAPATPENLSVLLLPDYARKVCAIHECGMDNECDFDSLKRTVKHSTDVLAGGHFHLLSHQQGYPPRRA